MATYYVAKTGSDSNPGTLASPFLTVVKGASVLVAGDILYIRAGTYIEVVNFSTAGTAAAYITTIGYPGESAIISGNDVLPTIGSNPLVLLSGAYNEIKDLTIQNSFGVGCQLHGVSATATNIISQRNFDSGMILRGNRSIARDCRIYYNCRSNDLGVNIRPPFWGQGISANRPSIVSGATAQFSTIERCTVLNNWGEGISTFESNNNTLQDNIVYDNWINFYISDSRNGTYQRNLVYCTPNNIAFVAKGNQQSGMLCGDEKGGAFSSQGNTVANNMVLGCSYNLYSGSPGIVNGVFVYNTFVNSVDNAFHEGGVVIATSTHSNSIFKDNIIVQEDALAIATITSNVGLAFDYNCWSKLPPVNGRGTHDKNSNALLAKGQSFTPGGISGEYFKTLTGSPARNAATVLSQVTDDYYKTLRGSLPDIGAYEFVSPTLGTQKFWVI